MLDKTACHISKKGIPPRPLTVYRLEMEPRYAGTSSVDCLVTSHTIFWRQTASESRLGAVPTDLENKQTRDAGTTLLQRRHVWERRQASVCLAICFDDVLTQSHVACSKSRPLR
jgi:hypothetical protein